jgi:pimeloyl-ACP methyl ester carboxylesterase
MPILNTPAGMIDYVEAGEGPTVILLHSSVSGNREWRTLTAALQDRFRVIAPNLIGYGQTRSWPGVRRQTLADQSRVVLPFVDRTDGPVHVVGHSFGGTVAMQVALERPERVAGLVLIEPNLVQMLRHFGREEAYREALDIHDLVKGHGGRGEWDRVAAVFADYWNGDGTWSAMPAEKRASFATALRPNYHEWDAVLGDGGLIEGTSRLSAQTLVIWAQDTKRPMIEGIQVLREQAPHWRYRELPEGGHMAPLTRPDLVNPLVDEFLRQRASETPGAR